MDLSYDPDLDNTIDTGHYKIPKTFETASKGLKFDSDKVPMDLLPYESLEEVAKVLGFGERKYCKLKIEEFLIWVKERQQNVSIQIEKIMEGGYAALVTTEFLKKKIQNTRSVSDNISVSIDKEIKRLLEIRKENMNDKLIEKRLKERDLLKEDMESLTLRPGISLKDKVVSALSAKKKEQGFIQTTVMKLEGLEESYVLGATTDLAFLTTLSTVLQEQFNISLNINDFLVPGAGNWAKGIEMRRLLSAAMRHIGQFNSGQDLDEESQTLHIANAACNLLFAIWMYKNKPELDNRWAKELFK